MKKTLIILVAVALLGIGVYAKEQGKPEFTSANPQAPLSTGSNNSSNSSSSSKSRGQYKNGTYTGTSAETLYGPVQIKVVVSGGKITNIQFLRMPNDEQRSRSITAMAEPQLKQLTLNKQGVDIDMVTGATSTYYGYQESLQAALDSAKNT
jgi:uncharacterized protein with FMN-binding domain